MKKKLLSSLALTVALASSAHAALPTAVSDAISEGADNSTAVATAGVAVMAVFITWKLIRRAVNRLV